MFDDRCADPSLDTPYEYLFRLAFHTGEDFDGLVARFFAEEPEAVQVERVAWEAGLLERDLQAWVDVPRLEPGVLHPIRPVSPSPTSTAALDQSHPVAANPAVDIARASAWPGASVLIRMRRFTNGFSSRVRGVLGLGHHLRVSPRTTPPCSPRIEDDPDCGNVTNLGQHQGAHDEDEDEEKYGEKEEEARENADGGDASQEDDDGNDYYTDNDDDEMASSRMLYSISTDSASPGLWDGVIGHSAMDLNIWTEPTEDVRQHQRLERARTWPRDARTGPSG